MNRDEPDDVRAATPAAAVPPAWISALEARHLANLRVSELTRALRALSSAYVERRQHSALTIEKAGGHKVRGALDTAGKRAAFALFYAPLHFMAVAHVVVNVGAHRPGPASIFDVGCGTGAAAAAWALSSRSTPSVVGIDRHRWAVDETRWTYAQLGIRGRARLGDVTRARLTRDADAIVAAYVLNELPDAARRRVEEELLAAAHRGARVLIIEPISRAITPWWDETAERFSSLGGRSNDWRVPIELPPTLKMLDKAAGLDHRELRFRTLLV